MSSGPKRHHHLAQTIQRNFLEKGQDKLWWYSREKDTYEERTTRSIGHAYQTYTFSAISGEERYALERAVSKVEDKAGPALRKLEKSEDLTQAERNAIAELVGFQFLRTPSKIAVIQEMRDTGGVRIVGEFANYLANMTAEEFAAYITTFEAKTGNALTLSQQELVDSLKNRPPKVVSTKEGTLDSLVDLGTELTLEYSKRSWVVMHAPRDSSFITSSEGVFSSGEPSERGASPGPGVPGTNDRVSVLAPRSPADRRCRSGNDPSRTDPQDRRARHQRQTRDRQRRDLWFASSTAGVDRQTERSCEHSLRDGN